MNSSTNSLSHQFWREKTGKITFLKSTEVYIVIYCMNTHKLCSLHGRRSTSFGANYSQNQGIHSKRSYRDAKMKKLEEFWRENAVGIGLYNEFVLWWGVRFERLLAALKSKRHKQAQSCFVFGASV